MCGGSWGKDGRRMGGEGLSPRVRGKPAWSPSFPTPTRSIPACAGEAHCAGIADGPAVVYPRVCGGSLAVCAHSRNATGLSPRVRGKRGEFAEYDRSEGSIPACAGEAAWDISKLLEARVYPRVCGGSYGKPTAGRNTSGLSPRVRGKPGGRLMTIPMARSIPACAGEAASPASSSPAATVYPRVCGGSRHRLARRRIGGGLSPRVRGKQ